MAEAEWMFSFPEVAAMLPKDDTGVMRFCYALKHGSMKLGLYAPAGHDTQGPHKQDELYVIAAGSGVFVKDGERRRFKAHDAIFVEAGVRHHFEDFTPDLAAWVIFWGPDGGEH